MEAEQQRSVCLGSSIILNPRSLEGNPYDFSNFMDFLSWYMILIFAQRQATSSLQIHKNCPLGRQ